MTQTLFGFRASVFCLFSFSSQNDSLIAAFTAFHLNALFIGFLLKLALGVFGRKQGVCVVSQQLNRGFWSVTLCDITSFLAHYFLKLEQTRP